MRSVDSVRIKDEGPLAGGYMLTFSSFLLSRMSGVRAVNRYFSVATETALQFGVPIGDPDAFPETPH